MDRHSLGVLGGFLNDGPQTTDSVRPRPASNESKVRLCCLRLNIQAGFCTMKRGFSRNNVEQTFGIAHLTRVPPIFVEGPTCKVLLPLLLPSTSSNGRV